MAYYLYKKIRERQRLASPTDLQEHISPADPSRDQAPQERDPNLPAVGTISEFENEKSRDTPDEPTEDARKVEVDKAEKKAMRRYRWKIIAGIFFPILVWSLNKTMIAATIPFIASDFGMNVFKFDCSRSIANIC